MTSRGTRSASSGVRRVFSHEPTHQPDDALGTPVIPLVIPFIPFNAFDKARCLV